MFTIGTELLGRYTIEAQLGCGGMATVYRARDSKRGERVALKVLNSDQAGVPRRVARFLREFAILERLRHPGVVAAFELHADASPPMFSMELVAGRALSEREPGKALGNEESLPLLLQVARALRYVHEQRVLYCDLKPANVLLVGSAPAADPLVKIVDFGISRERSETLTEEDAPKMVGTSYYMSPEQVRGAALDERSDVYSFGVMAFELVTGRLPYDEESLFNITASHLAARVPSARSFNRSLPGPIDTMIRICMEKEPGDRYRAMDEIVGRLESVQQRESRPGLFGAILSRLLR